MGDKWSYKVSDIVSSGRCKRHQMIDNQESSSSSLNLAAIPPLRPQFMLTPSLAMKIIFLQKLVQVVNTKSTFNSLQNVISNLTWQVFQIKKWQCWLKHVDPQTKPKCFFPPITAESVLPSHRRAIKLLHVTLLLMDSSNTDLLIKLINLVQALSLL